MLNDCMDACPPSGVVWLYEPFNGACPEFSEGLRMTLFGFVVLLSPFDELRVNGKDQKTGYFHDPKFCGETSGTDSFFGGSAESIDWIGVVHRGYCVTENKSVPGVSPRITA